MLIAASVTIEDLVIGRHIHEEHVAQAPAGAESGLFGDDRAQHLVRVQAPFHHQLGLP